MPPVNYSWFLFVMPPEESPSCRWLHNGRDQRSDLTQAIISFIGTIRPAGPSSFVGPKSYSIYLNKEANFAQENEETN
jgi:hypothetical protein